MDTLSAVGKLWPTVYSTLSEKHCQYFFAGPLKTAALNLFDSQTEFSITPGLSLMNLKGLNGMRRLHGTGMYGYVLP
jgi:hypothetical protein